MSSRDSEPSIPLRVYFEETIVDALPPSARAEWDRLVESTPMGQQYRSKAYNEVDAFAEARGRAFSVISVLETRGAEIPVELRELILDCQDSERLDLWLRRAVTIRLGPDGVPVAGQASP